MHIEKLDKHRVFMLKYRLALKKEDSKKWI